MCVVDQGSNPIDLESSGSGQDPKVGSLRARLKCLVLVSPHIHPVTRPISLGALGWPSLVEDPSLGHIVHGFIVTFGGRKGVGNHQIQQASGVINWG